MIVPFVDSVTGIPVYINPEYVVALHPIRPPPTGSVSSSSGTVSRSGFRAITERWPTSSPEPRRRAAAFGVRRPWAAARGLESQASRSIVSRKMSGIPRVSNQSSHPQRRHP